MVGGAGGFIGALELLDAERLAFSVATEFMVGRPQPPPMLSKSERSFTDGFKAGNTFRSGNTLGTGDAFRRTADSESAVVSFYDGDDESPRDGAVEKLIRELRSEMRERDAALTAKLNTLSDVVEGLARAVQDGQRGHISRVNGS